MILMQSPSSADQLPTNQPTPQGQSAPSFQPDWLQRATLIQEGLQNTLTAKEASPIIRQTAADVTASSSALSNILSGPDYVDQSAGYVFDSHSARITRADSLWPGGSAIFEDATGANPLPPATQLPKIGIWDQGGVALNRQGFQGRISYGPNQLLENEAPHTILVAEFIAREDQDLNDPTRHQNLQGLAWESSLEIYTSSLDYPEMIDAAIHDPANNKIGMTFSNHSYSPGAGWEEPFTWWGPIRLSENEEDPEFGSYTLNSRYIDSITYHAQTYLPVFSSSNSANNGGSSPGETYTAVQVIQDPNNPLLYTQQRIPNQTAPRAGTAGTPIYDLNSPPDPDKPTPEEVNPAFENDEDIGKGIGPGLDTIKSTGVAKNNLTVGAIYTGQYETNPSSETVGLSHFSSRGPIDDGRVKPDLVAPSTFEPLKPSSLTFGNTSSAAPAVTGALALLQEINADSNGPRYLASTWKALVLNTAMDCQDLSYLIEELKPDSSTEYEINRVTNYFGIKPQRPGANDNDPLLVGPDYFFGWGLVDAEAAAQLLVKNLRSESGTAHLCEHTLHDPSNDDNPDNNLTIEIPFAHDGVSPSIRAMLCWTDPPYQSASPSTLFEGNFDPETGMADDPNLPTNLVNDLDLWIVDPDGNIHRPWVLDKTNPFTPATRDPQTTNDLDNVEQVVIDNPIPGTYTLMVSHKGKLTATQKVIGSDQYEQITGREQHFSLAISGNLAPNPARPILEFVERLPRTSFSEYVTFIINGFVGVYYQLESSDDLISWTDEVEVIGQKLPAIPVTTQSPFPVTILQEPIREKKFYRIKEITPPNQPNN